MQASWAESDSQAIAGRDDALIARLKALAEQYPRYGYLMLHNLLKQEGHVVSKKRTYRLYTHLGLQVRTKKRKKLIRPRLVKSTLTASNQRWSMDFVSDQLANGRRFRVLNVVDDYSRELVGQLVSVSISGQQVGRYLSELIELYGKPTSIVCGNGPEYTSKAMFFWSQETSVKLDFIQPGKPTQNAFVESLNGKLKNECLNCHWFESLTDAKLKIEAWRDDYNKSRPHRALNNLPPLQFLASIEN